MTLRRFEAGLNDDERNGEPSLLDASILLRASVLLIGALAQVTLSILTMTVASRSWVIHYVLV